MSQFNFGSNLGGASAGSSSFTFGAPNKTAPTAFGVSQQQPSGSITFGTPIAAVAPNVTNQPLSVGSTSNVTPSSNVNFNVGNKAMNLNFGTSSQPNMSTPAQPIKTIFGSPSTGNISFAPTSTVTSLGVATNANFGTPVSSVGMNFNNPLTSTGFNIGGTTTTTTLNPLSGGINFGTAPTSTPNPLGANVAPASTGFNLGVNPTTGLNFSPGTSLANTVPSFGLGSSLASQPTNVNFKTLMTTTSSGPTSTNMPLGLGGIDSSQLRTGIVTTGNNETLAAKENLVPNEILQSIESFKLFVKEQKHQSSNVSRGSARPLGKVKSEIDALNNVLVALGNELHRNEQVANKLKHDSAKCLENAEMAQRTNDTPPGLQFENNAPLKYFIELVNQFEQDLQSLRVQIDVTDKHFQSLHEQKFLTSQELANGMRRLHDTFVALAGRLQSVHSQVENHKEQYLNLRKYILKDPTNIFMKSPSKEQQALDAALQGLEKYKTITGPTPFANDGSPYNMTILSAQQTVRPPPAYPTNVSNLSFGGGSNSNSGILGFGTNILAATSYLGNPTTYTQSSSLDSSFQLQNPPPGNKRGKR